MLDGVNSSNCKTYNPPERLSAWKKIKGWMRSPGCVSAYHEWVKMGGQLGGNIDETGYEDGSEDPSNASSSCCEDCVVGLRKLTSIIGRSQISTPRVSVLLETAFTPLTSVPRQRTFLF